MRLKSPTSEPICVSMTNGQGCRIGPEGREVPEMFRREAFAAGAIPAAMKVEEFSAPQETPVDDSRHALLVAGVKQMLEANNPDDFTGAGLPDRRKLSGIVGWNVNVQELSAAWSELNQQVAE